MRKIAIVFLGSHYFDARCINMIRTLSKKNCSVTIYSSSKKLNPPVKIFNTLVREVYIKTSSLPVIRYLDWLIKIYREVNKESYDTIIASDLYSLLPIVLKKNNYRVIYDSREIYTKLSIHVKNPIKNKIISIVERFCIKKINKIMVTAKSDLDYLKNIYSKNKISYKIIYNYPLKSFVVLNSNFFRNKLNIDKKNTILLYQGVLQKNRGIIQLIKIIQKTQNTVGIIIGSGEYKKNIQNYIKKHNLRSCVHLLPAIPYPQLLQITSSADLGIALINPNSLSNQLALPNKLFEYAVSGLPVLASSLPNIRKYILKYNLGWSIDHNDLQGQVNIIKSLQNNTKQAPAAHSYSSFYWESQENDFYSFIINDE